MYLLPHNGSRFVTQQASLNSMGIKEKFPNVGERYIDRIRTVILFFVERFVANIVCTGLANPQ